MATRFVKKIRGQTGPKLMTYTVLAISVEFYHILRIRQISVISYVCQIQSLRNDIIYKRSYNLPTNPIITSLMTYSVIKCLTDNVHAMNSMMLLKALNEANIQYQTQIYPDKNHGLQNSLDHVYRRMTNFLDKCYGYKSTKVI